jgi:hypothetical protein
VAALPHSFKRIRLNLARSPEFPQGSTRHGYEFVAPLDAAGHIDLKLWKAHKENCRVRRFWEGEDDQVGRLVHRGGDTRGRWAFDYNPQETADDESGYRFESHSFRQGDYVSIRSEDDEMYTFLVVSAEPAA